MIDPITFQIPQAFSDAGLFPSLGSLGRPQQPMSLGDLGKALTTTAPTQTAPTVLDTAPTSKGGSNYQSAISNIESGGRYDLLGPVTKNGDRAYGKYQIMGTNIPDWTKQTFGKSMTTDQFLANPAAQDAVFDKIFGGYVTKYGPTGAAKAWFAGEGGMNNPNAKDMLGTSVESYARRFDANLGDQ